MRLVFTDPGWWEWKDSGCQIQNIRLRISHRFEFPGHRMGQRQIGMSCCVCVFVFVFRVKSLCSTACTLWVSDSVLSTRLMKLWKSRTPRSPRNCVSHRWSFTALVSFSKALINTQRTTVFICNDVLIYGPIFVLSPAECWAELHCRGIVHSLSDAAVYFLPVLAEDAIKAALADYKLKQKDEENVPEARN